MEDTRLVLFGDENAVGCYNSNVMKPYKDKGLVQMMHSTLTFAAEDEPTTHDICEAFCALPTKDIPKAPWYALYLPSWDNGKDYSKTWKAIRERLAYVNRGEYYKEGVLWIAPGPGPNNEMRYDSGMRPDRRGRNPWGAGLGPSWARIYTIARDHGDTAHWAFAYWGFFRVPDHDEFRVSWPTDKCWPRIIQTTPTWPRAYPAGLPFLTTAEQPIRYANTFMIHGCGVASSYVQWRAARLGTRNNIESYMSSDLRHPTVSGREAMAAWIKAVTNTFANVRR